MTVIKYTDEERATRLADAILELKALRTQAAVAVAEFFHRMIGLEADEPLWRGDPGARTGYTTFAELLDTNDICKPSRFERFKETVAVVGWDVVRTIGFDSAALILSVPPNATSVSVKGMRAAEAVTQELVNFTDRNKTPPSVQQTRAITRKHYIPSSVPPRTKTDAQRVKELEAENQDLLEQVERLTAALAAAEAKLAARGDTTSAKTKTVPSRRRASRRNEVSA